MFNNFGDKSKKISISDQKQKESSKDFQLGDENRYKDLEGVSLKKLQIGLWYVEHKKQLAYLLKGFLILISLFSWSYFFYSFGFYLLKGQKEDEEMVKKMVAVNSIDPVFMQTMRAKDLQIFSVSILKTTNNKYDFAVKIKNPNDKFYAKLTYKFLVDQYETGVFNDFIFPKEEKYLLSIDNKLNFIPRRAKLKLINIDWQRIDPHKYPRWNEFYKSHTNFIIKDKEFIPAQLSKLTEKIPINTLKFAIINNTAYNYWNLDLNIVLFSRSKIVGLNKYQVNEFRSGENRDIEISWPGRLGRVDKIEIFPSVNILDPNIYMPFK